VQSSLVTAHEPPGYVTSAFRKLLLIREFLLGLETNESRSMKATEVEKPHFYVAVGGAGGQNLRRCLLVSLVKVS
jgi:hypothetical protein